MELFTLTSPTIIRIPPKLYHCPINFRNINEDKPIVFSAIYCDGDWSKITPRKREDGEVDFQYDGAGVRRCIKDRTKECIYCGSCFSEGMRKRAESAKKDEPIEMLKPYYEMAKKPRTGNFDKYVYSFKMEDHDDERFLSPRAGFLGTDEMADSRLRYFYNLVKQPCEVGETHFHHSVEEYLIFTGADIAKFFEFDAEIEVSLGASPDDMETFTITEPTVIRVPSGMWHSAVKFKHVGAPVNFTPFYPSGNYGKIMQDGDKLVYEGSEH